MSSLKLNQETELNDIVNKRNKWIFCNIHISKYLVNSDNSLIIPSGKIWYSSFTTYPSYIYNLLKLSYLLVKQLFSEKISLPKKSTHILFSTGQGYDLKNYRKLFLDSNVEVIQLEAFDTNQKINFNIVKIKSAFSFFLENFREANIILKRKLPLSLREKIVNHSLPQLATYAYFCAFLSAIKEQIPHVTIFHSGAYFLSIAATRVGIETVNLYHGLAEKEGRASFPLFDHIYVYATEDKNYLEDLSPSSNISLYPVKELSKLEKRVIFILREYDNYFFPDGSSAIMSEKNLSELLTYFLKKDYKIFLKRHPSYSGSLADKIASKYNLEMIDPEKDTSEILLYLRPSFIVGWRSTALCESLRHGVVPISLEKEEDITKYPMIYPIQKRSLSWKEEKEKILALLEDMNLYSKTLSELRTR